MTIEPLKLGFTPEQFINYVADAKLEGWRGKGVVLHNTALPNLSMVDDYLAGENRWGKNAKLRKWTFPELIENWWQRYIKLGWNAGPHLFINRDKIWVATPLDVRGTHSPSFNATHWGVELVGDYSRETLPPSILYNASIAIGALFHKIGKQPDSLSFRFHGEDPKTTHKGCPGKNVGSKAYWISEIKEAMAKEIAPGGQLLKQSQSN